MLMLARVVWCDMLHRQRLSAKYEWLVYLYAFICLRFIIASNSSFVFLGKW